MARCTGNTPNSLLFASNWSQPTLAMRLRVFLFCGVCVRGSAVGVLRWFCFAGAFRFVVCVPVAFVFVSLLLLCVVCLRVLFCLVFVIAWPGHCFARCVALSLRMCVCVLLGAACCARFFPGAFALWAVAFVGGVGFECAGARLRFCCLAFALCPLFACVSLGFVLCCVRSFCFSFFAFDVNSLRSVWLFRRVVFSHARGDFVFRARVRLLLVLVCLRVCGCVGVCVLGAFRSVARALARFFVCVGACVFSLVRVVALRCVSVCLRCSMSRFVSCVVLVVCVRSMRVVLGLVRVGAVSLFSFVRAVCARVCANVCACVRVCVCVFARVRVRLQTRLSDTTCLLIWECGGVLLRSWTGVRNHGNGSAASLLRRVVTRFGCICAAVALRAFAISSFQ